MFMSTLRAFHIVAVFLLVSLAGLAQPAAPANPLSSDVRMAFGYTTSALAAAAEKMPAESYAFKPVPEVRSFGQIVGRGAVANDLQAGRVSR